MIGGRALLTRFRSLVGGATSGDATRELETARRKIAEKNEQLKRLRKRLRARAGRSEQEFVGQRRGAAVPAGGDAAPAFFIVGRAKSGTSWLRSIMDAHPEVLCVNEGRFFGRTYRGHGAIPRSLYGAMADSEYLATWVKRSPWSRGDDPEGHLRNMTRAVVDYLMAARLAKAGKKIAGDKTPLIGPEVVREISEIYPEARVVHIIRDGRDVAISSAHHVWNNAKDKGGPNDLSAEVLDKRDRYRADPEGFLANGESIFAGKQLLGTARNWAELVGRAREDGSALLGENYAEVRYEDLLQRPEEEVGRLLRFLGAEADEETVRRCVEVTSFEKVSRRERGREDSSSFFRKGVAGDWRGVFTKEDKKVFKEVAGGTLIELGYEGDRGW